MSAGHRPRKRFGQNFLVDRTVIDRIVATIAPRAGERLIEIGPGREALTGPLLEAGVDLTVVEIDRDLAAALRSRRPGLDVVEADALEVDFASLAGGRPYRLVGNLPYNVSTPLLFHVLAQRPPPEDMHFMLQKEVVARLCAGPGSRTYGRLSLACHSRAEAATVLEVPPSAFEPRPKVDSALVRLRPRPEPLVPPDREAAFDAVVRQAFSQRRKTLRNSLKGLLDGARIEAAGVDPAARPEQLDLAGFLALAAVVESDGPPVAGG